MLVTSYRTVIDKNKRYVEVDVFYEVWLLQHIITLLPDIKKDAKVGELSVKYIC